MLIPLGERGSPRPARGREPRHRALPADHEHRLPGAHRRHRDRGDHGPRRMSEALADGGDPFPAEPAQRTTAVAAHGVGLYAVTSRRCVAYCDAHGITAWDGLDPQHMRSFAAQCHRRGLAPRSVQRRLSATPQPVPLPDPRGRTEARPVRGRAGAEGPQAPARHARCGHDGAPARISHRRQPRGARQGDHGALLLLGSAPRGAARSRPDRPRPARPRRAGAGQGPQGAHRAGRAAGGRGAVSAGSRSARPSPASASWPCSWA